MGVYDVEAVVLVGQRHHVRALERDVAHSCPRRRLGGCRDHCRAVVDAQDPTPYRHACEVHGDGAGTAPDVEDLLVVGKVRQQVRG